MGNESINQETYIQGHAEALSIYQINQMTEQMKKKYM